VRTKSEHCQKKATTEYHRYKGREVPYYNFPGLFLVLSASPTLLSKYMLAKVLDGVTDLGSVKGRIVTVVPKKSTCLIVWLISEQLFRIAINRDRTKYPCK
jgi:hypothetical protein